MTISIIRCQSIIRIRQNSSIPLYGMGFRMLKFKKEEVSIKFYTLKTSIKKTFLRRRDTVYQNFIGSEERLPFDTL